MDVEVIPQKRCSNYLGKPTTRVTEVLPAVFPDVHDFLWLKSQPLPSSLLLGEIMRLYAAFDLIGLSRQRQLNLPGSDSSHKSGLINAHRIKAQHDSH